MRLTFEDGFVVLEEKSLQSHRFFEGKLLDNCPSGKDFLSSRLLSQGVGEVVFNTSITGYQEILTDPSYYGQIVCMTAPHIGNTGINEEDMESNQAWARGFVVHELSPMESNWRSTGSLTSFLVKQKVPLLCDVDTRALTRFLRNQGVARGFFIRKSEAHLIPELLANLPAFEGQDLISQVSTKQHYRVSATSPLRFRVAALDFGAKTNLFRILAHLGCDITVYPASTPAHVLLESKPDGVFLSNGPGDPSAAPYAVKTVHDILGQVPVFGVCMGHQILALAVGAKTYKLKFGHRGSNHPVQEIATRSIAITSQNHGYAVDPDSLPRFVKVTHESLNDRTVEGISIERWRAFSVQYHPEASPGPHDAQNLFGEFIAEMSRS